MLLVRVISDGPLEGNAPHVRRLFGWPTLQRIQGWVWGCLSVPSMSFEKLGIMGKLMERCESVASLSWGLRGPICYSESGLGKEFGRATKLKLYCLVMIYESGKRGNFLWMVPRAFLVPSFSDQA